MNTLTRINDLLEGATGRRLVPRDPAAVNDPALEAAKLVVPGQLSLAEARALGALVQESDPSRPIVEIGTLFGWSTLVICLFKHPDQTLITVDNYSWNPLGLTPEQHHSLTTERLSSLTSSGTVRQLNMDKDDFYESYSGPPPAVFFCDADHTYGATKADLVFARSVGADVICGDDYSPSDFPGVVQAVAEMGGLCDLIDELFVLGEPD